MADDELDDLPVSDRILAALERIEAHVSLLTQEKRAVMDIGSAQADALCQVAAIRFVMVRLLGSHANLHPDGVGRVLLDTPDENLEDFTSPELDLPPAVSAGIAEHLRLIVRDARRLADKGT